MCIGHRHQNRTGHAHGQQHEDRFSIFQACFSPQQIDLRTSRTKYEHFNSRSMFSMVLILVFEYLVFSTIDLESLRQIFMHPMRFRAWKWSNPRFLTKKTSLLDLSWSIKGSELPASMIFETSRTHRAYIHPLSIRFFANGWLVSCYLMIAQCQEHMMVMRKTVMRSDLNHNCYLGLLQVS